MSIGQAKELGGAKFKEQWGPSVLAVLLAAAAIIVATVAVLGLGGLIIAGPAAVGLMYVYYQNINGEKIVYTDMLHPIKTNFGEVVLGYLLKMLFVAGPFILVGTAIASMAGFLFLIPVVAIIFIVLLLIAACVAFVIISLHLMLVEYILMREEDAKGWEAVKRSKRYMAGNKGRMFGFELSFIGWWILVGVFFPLALFVVPYYLTSKLYFLGSIYEAGVAMDNAPAPRFVEPAPQYFEAAPQYEAPQYDAEPQQFEAEPQTFEAASQQFEAAPQQEGEFKYCGQCGARIPAQASFCSKCGAPQ
ncbi:MAG: DUF975 family protein [Lachnospiraceae bacterium]|nr:DUF975 family protein [Lachnospiraceae bacterium]